MVVIFLQKKKCPKTSIFYGSELVFYSKKFVSHISEFSSTCFEQQKEFEMTQFEVHIFVAQHTVKCLFRVLQGIPLNYKSN